MSSEESDILSPRSYRERTSSHGIYLSMTYDRIRFEVVLLPSENGEGEDQRLLQNVIEEHEKFSDDEKIDAVMDPIRFVTRKLCQPLIPIYAPGLDKNPPHDHLASVLEQEVLNFRLEMLCGQFQLTPRHPFSTTLELAGAAPSTVSVGTPKVLAVEVEILQEILCDKVYKVRVNDQFGCCKIVNKRAFQIERELKTFQKLFHAGLSALVQIPQLIAVVEHNSKICGLIETWIQPPDDLPNLGELLYLEKTAQTFSRTMREKWFSQIAESVETLHKAGATWGDVKPSNVLIDSSYDAWVVDFGGGYTHGWTSEELTGTIEGDLRALAKFYGFLDLDNDEE